MSYVIQSILKASQTGHVPVCEIDLNSTAGVIVQDESVVTLPVFGEVHCLKFRWLNEESTPEAYNTFMSTYFSNRIFYDSLPYNVAGAPGVRFPLGFEKWFCYSFSKAPDLNDGLRLRYGVSNFNFDNEHNYEATYPTGLPNSGYASEWYGATLEMYAEEGDTEAGIFISGAFVLAHYEGRTYFGFTHLYAESTNHFHMLPSLYLYDTSELPFGIEEFQEEYGEPSEPGGYGGSTGGGNFDHSSDHVGFPSDPSISISAQGFLNVYKTTGTDLDGLVNEIMPEQELPDIPEWAETFGLPEIAKYLAVGINSVNIAIKNFFNNNLLKYVIDIHVIPVSPTGGSRQNIHCGVRTLSSSAIKLSDDYVDFDCGTLNIKECYKNFVDYIGTKCECFLPGVGFVPINPELFQDGKIQVKYKFNIIDGSFVACIISTSSKSKLSDSVVGQYSGTMCVHMPISSSDYASLASGIASGVTALGGAITASPGVTMASAGNVVSAIANMANMTTYNMSNGFNATAGFSGCREAYLKISRQVPSFATSYPHENGLPLNVTRTLSTLSGYTVCDKPHLDGLHATESEKKAIYDLLTSGVIL